MTTATKSRKVRKFKTRFGKEVEIPVKDKVFCQKPGEDFLSALVRTYYPKDYNRIHKTEAEMMEVLA